MADYYSCFISYSHKDADFAESLYECLQAAGISCWKDNHEIGPGSPIYESIAEGVRYWDKLILCCSEHSLNSWWVDNEVKILLEKEQQLSRGKGDDKGKRFWLLLPLDLDGYVWDWNSGISTQLKIRQMPKVHGWKDDPAVIDDVCKQIASALLVDGGRAAPPTSRL
jgi:TIR domain-containing protein